MSSLLRNLLIRKHRAPSNLMYSKYQIIKRLKNCFQSMNCFSWIKLILVLIYLKYWYYNPHTQNVPTSHHLCQNLPYPTETLSNTNLIMFFIGFNILSYSIPRQANTGIGYTKSYIKTSQSNLLSNYIWYLVGQTRYPSKSWVFKNRFSFKFRQHA